MAAVEHDTEYDSRIGADVTDDLRRRIKIAAAKNDMSMAEYIRDAVLEKLEEEAD